MNTTITTVQASARPARHTAFDDPGCLVVLEDTGEPMALASYALPMVNVDHQRLTDGVYGQLRRMPGKRTKPFLVEVITTLPWGTREQHVRLETFATREEADAALLSLIFEARQWVLQRAGQWLAEHRPDSVAYFGVCRAKRIAHTGSVIVPWP